MKVCRKCKVELETSEFNKNSAAPDGLYPRCKKCLAKYRQQNRQRTSDYKREYYLNNREEIMSKRTSERKILHTSNRRAKSKSNGVYALTEKELRKLRDKECVYCGSSHKIELDHVIPISRGGTHGIGNLVPSCMKCNRSKSSKFITEWRYSSLK